MTDIVDVHRDWPALDKLGGTGVDHDAVGVVAVQCLGDGVVPDGVAGEVQALLAFEDEPGDRGHLLGEFAVAVPGRCPGDLDTRVGTAPLNRADVLEAVLAKGRRLGRLTEDRVVGGQPVDGRVVEVVAVAVGNEDSVVRQPDVGGGDERVLAVVRRVGDRRDRPRLAQHRVDEQGRPADLDQECGVSDQLDLGHGVGWGRPGINPGVDTGLGRANR